MASKIDKAAQVYFLKLDVVVNFSQLILAHRKTTVRFFVTTLFPGLFF